MSDDVDVIPASLAELEPATAGSYNFPTNHAVATFLNGGTVRGSLTVSPAANPWYDIYATENPNGQWFRGAYYSNLGSGSGTNTITNWEDVYSYGYVGTGATGKSLLWATQCESGWRNWTTGLTNVAAVNFERYEHVFVGTNSVRVWGYTTNHDTLYTAWGVVSDTTTLIDRATATQMMAIGMGAGADTTATFSSLHGNTGYMFVRDVAGGRMSFSGNNGIGVEPYGGGGQLFCIDTSGASSGVTRMGLANNVLVGNYGTAAAGIEQFQVIPKTGNGVGILWTFDYTNSYRSSIDLAFNGSTVAGNTMSFLVCNGTATNKVNVLTLAGDKSATFSGAVSGITTLSLSGNLTMVPGTTNPTIDFSTGFNSTAIQLYNGGAGHSYGWGLTAGVMEFFVDPAGVYAFRTGGTFGSGAAAFQIGASAVTCNVASAFALDLSINNNIKINWAGNATATATHLYKDSNNHTLFYSDFYANDCQVDFATLKLNVNSGGLTQLGGPLQHKSYTVSGLPAAGTAGRTAYASNGRNPGQGAAAGTGVLVFDNGTNWIACSTGSTVAA